jgi:hypothetical protein
LYKKTLVLTYLATVSQSQRDFTPPGGTSFRPLFLMNFVSTFLMSLALLLLMNFLRLGVGGGWEEGGGEVLFMNPFC